MIDDVVFVQDNLPRLDTTSFLLKIAWAARTAACQSAHITHYVHSRMLPETFIAYGSFCGKSRYYEDVRLSRFRPRQTLCEYELHQTYL